jgi:hypothetical protein
MTFLPGAHLDGFPMRMRRAVDSNIIGGKGAEVERIVLGILPGPVRHLPQEGVRVDPGVVTVAPMELQGVASDG